MRKRKKLHRQLAFGLILAMLLTMIPVSVWADDAQDAAAEQSRQQIVEQGGSNGSLEKKGVEVSKTISATGSENVFDINLQVKTTQDIREIYDTPDAAVAIVMDISNTMNDGFPKGSGTNRYDAAISASEDFINSFQQRSENSRAERKIGYVAFNTDAHKISELTDCKTAEQAAALKTAVKTKTDPIIGQTGYEEAHSRFTNMEAGLKMASDMLAGSNAANKYIIFLSDGFPTTYIRDGYSGYDPYCTGGTPGIDGVFCDMVTDKYCDYGTSYSNKAALKARTAAEAIKKSEVKIFTVGIDIGGQTIKNYINKEGAEFSVVDRESEKYELGSADSADAFKNWLKNSIGSGCYYDSSDADGLKNAFESIFAEIKQELEKKVVGKWVAADPVPAGSGCIDFVGFFDKTGNLSGRTLTGQWQQNTENTAIYGEDNNIAWDLKKSGYTLETNENTSIYTYSVKYRIRLTNENSGFISDNSYMTNGDTGLKYVICTDGQQGEEQTIDFPVPEVKGYLGELCFDKKDSVNNLPVQGAEFSLKHDSDICKSMSNATCSAGKLSLADMTAVSDGSGKVEFKAIASGHAYKVYETKAAPGYSQVNDLEIGTVIVSYGQTCFIPKNAKEPVDKFVMSNTPDTGNLILEKRVDRDSQQGLCDPGSGRSYEFTVKGPDRAYGDYEAVRSSGEIQNSEKIIFDKNHTAVIRLKDGESLKLCNIPVTVTGETYEVAETNVADTARLIMLTPEFKTGQTSVNAAKTTAEVNSSADTNIVCINRFTKPADAECIPDITINKSIIGDEAIDNSGDSFKFTMTPLGYSLPEGGLTEELLTSETMPSLGEFTISAGEAGSNKTITKDSCKYTQSGTYYYKITETQAGNGYRAATAGYYIKDTVSSSEQGLDYTREIYRIDALQSANKGIENLDEVFGSGAELNTEGAQYTNDGVLQFVNIFTAPRSLTIQKTVGGNAYSTTYDFEFTVCFDELEPGTAIKGKYISRNGEAKIIEKTTEAGEAGSGSVIRFTLKAYETMVLEDIPKNTQYTVTEKETPGYTTEAAHNGQKLQTAKEGISGEIRAYSGETVVFKNSRSEYVYIGCRLDITKKVTGIDNSNSSRKLMQNYCATVSCGDREIILKDFKWNGTCWQSSTYTITGYANIDYDIKENTVPEAEGYTFKDVTITGGDSGSGSGTAKPGETDQVTVTNTYEKTENNPPEEPEKPENPVNPDKPANPDKPDTTEPEPPAYDAAVVKTGDEAGIAAKAGIFGASALLLAGAAALTARRRAGKKDM